MKITKLQLLDRNIHTGEGGGSGPKCDSSTHEITRAPDGYLARHRSSGRCFFIPLSLAVAEVVPEDDDEPPLVAAAGKAAGGSRQPKNQTQVPG